MVARNADLSAELRFRHAKCGGREGFVAEALEFARHQLPTACHIFGVATEIETPKARVGIGVQIGVDAIHQTMAFAYGHV